MKRTLGWVGLTVVAAVGTFATGRQIWVAPVGALEPPGDLLPMFIVLSVLESVLFGVGLSFLLFGYGLLARSRQPLALTYGAYVATAWLLVSWWPHDNLHRVTVAGNWRGLLGIEYGFHLTLMVAGLVTAFFFFRVLGEAGQRT